MVSGVSAASGRGFRCSGPEFSGVTELYSDTSVACDTVSDCFAPSDFQVCESPFVVNFVASFSPLPPIRLASGFASVGKPTRELTRELNRTDFE